MSKTCEKCIHHDVCRYPVEGRAYPETCWKYKEERPHGEWIIEEDSGGRLIRRCTRCGHEYNMNGDAQNFCPNCGADMRKEGDEK